MLLEEFAAHLAVRKAKITVEKYVQAARSFKGYMATRATPVDRAHRGALRDYTSWMLTPEPGIAVPSPSTVHLMVAGIKSYLKFLRGSGVNIPEQEAADPPRIRSKLPVVMSRRELSAYAQCALQQDEPYATACLLLPFCGLRINELCHLRLGDVIVKKLSHDDHRYILHVRHGKGDKARLSPVFTGPSMAVSLALHDYLTNARPRWPRDISVPREERWLFPAPHNNKNDPISRMRIEKTLASWRGATGVTDLHPHLCRALFATALLSVAGDYDPIIDPLEVARYLGHRKGLDTLQEHYAGVRLENASEWMGLIARPTQTDYSTRRTI